MLPYNFCFDFIEFSASRLDERGVSRSALNSRRVLSSYISRLAFFFFIWLFLTSVSWFSASAAEAVVDRTRDNSSRATLALGSMYRIVCGCVGAWRPASRSPCGALMSKHPDPFSIQPDICPVLHFLRLRMCMHAD